MNIHPAPLSIAALDVLGVICLVLAWLGSVRVEVAWAPHAASPAQLNLERASEEVSALGRLGLALHLAATLLFIVALNHLLPPLVPGAMCGVGVLQSLPGGITPLLVRLLALGALVAWLTLDRLNRLAPQAPLARSTARAMLAAAPLMVVASWQTGQAVMHLDVATPVSCCAAVYDLAAAAKSTGSTTHAAGHLHVAGTLMAGCCLGTLAALVRRRSRFGTPRVTMIMAGFAMGWSILAIWSLVDVAGPYLYGAIGHRCPFCFFLPHHGAVGYVLYGSLALVLTDSIALVVSSLAAKSRAEVAPFSGARIRSGAVRLMVGVAAFTAVAFGPALLWRLRYGTWI